MSGPASCSHKVIHCPGEGRRRGGLAGGASEERGKAGVQNRAESDPGHEEHVSREHRAAGMLCGTLWDPVLRLRPRPPRPC